MSNKKKRVAKVLAKLEALLADGDLTPAELIAHVAGLAGRYQLASGAKALVENMAKGGHR